MKPRQLIWGIVGGLIGQASLLAADQPIVAGFDRFHADAKADVATGGRLLLGELNCTACHKADAAVNFSSKQSPLLGEIGARVKPEWMRAFIANPQATKPGTTMPNLFAGKTAAETQEIVEPLVHYLAALDATTKKAIPGGAAADGERLYHQVGCVACHGPRDAEVTAAGIIPLGDHGKKYKSAGRLAAFLHDPLAVRSSGRMPHLKLAEKEAASIARYLMGGQEARTRVAENPAETKPGLWREYFEESVNTVADIGKNKSTASGEAKDFDILQRKRDDNFSFRFSGYITAPRDGSYTFYTASDDGSALSIGSTQVVLNDGTHATQEESGNILLKAGKHHFTVVMFEQAGGEELTVSWQGPGFQKQKIPSSALSYAAAGYTPPAEDVAPTDAPPFKPDVAQIEKGRALFASIGCANCHQLGGKTPSPASTLAAKSLADIAKAGAKGCIAEQSQKGSPHFALGKAHAVAIQAALAKPQTPTPAQRIQTTMLALNCFACHERDGLGGPSDALKKYFTYHVPEKAKPEETALLDDLGDEGRIPPALTGVGAKLRSDWMKSVLTQGGVVRPYMGTRMPQFGAANVEHLVALFDQVDAKNWPDIAATQPPKDAVKVGWQLAGTKGLSCVQCHKFAEHKSLGIPTMDLTDMAHRLKPSWFRQWLLNPIALRQGTRMPSFWPEGKATRTDILGGNTEKQIEALWVYLSQGKKARIPEGIKRGAIELVAEKEAVIYRNFIEGDVKYPRGIAVGYPEKLSLVFDALDMRLAMIWQETFIDAAKHWVDRGAGFQKPLGENVVYLPTGAPLAVLATADAAWPSEKGKVAGYEFRGYALDKNQRPAFHYSFKEVAVADYPVAMPTKDLPYFVRTLNFQTAKPAANLYFRAAVANEIKANADGSFAVGEGLTMRFKGAAKPVIRQSGGKSELLVPINLVGGKAQVMQELIW